MILLIKLENGLPLIVRTIRVDDNQLMAMEGKRMKLKHVARTKKIPNANSKNEQAMLEITNIETGEVVKKIPFEEILIDDDHGDVLKTGKITIGREMVKMHIDRKRTVYRYAEKTEEKIVWTDSETETKGE